MRFLPPTRKGVAILAAVLTLSVSLPVSAQEKSPDDWQYAFELYGWLPQMRIKPDAGGTITFKLKDILKNLDMMFMGDIEMRKGDWSLGLDTIYMNLGNKQTLTSVVLPSQELEAGIDMRAVISTLTAGHTIARTDRSRLDIVGGARYLYVNVGLDFDLQATPGDKRAHLGGQNWDFLLGLEGKTLINDQWYFDYYADIGTGDSNLTWQGKVGGGYEFNKWAATFGFRYLRYNFTSKSNLDNLSVIGPYVGAKWTW